MEFVQRAPAVPKQAKLTLQPGRGAIWIDEVDISRVRTALTALGWTEP